MSLAERIRVLKEATARKEAESRDRLASEAAVFKDRCNEWIRGQLEPVLSRLQEIGLEELLQEIKTEQPDMTYELRFIAYYNYKHWWERTSTTGSFEEQKKWSVKSLNELRDLDFADTPHGEYVDIATRGKRISLCCSALWNMTGHSSMGSGADSLDTSRGDCFNIFVDSSDIVVKGRVKSKLPLSMVNRKQLENALFKAFTQPDYC